MLQPLLATLGLYFVQSITPKVLRLFISSESLAEFVQEDLGPRDQPSSATNVYTERAERALNNLKEALFVFLPIALILMIGGTKSESPVAIQGAWVFFIARCIYLPAYVSGVPGLRSVCWVGGWAGVVMMLLELPH